jgi:hypothetical protein
MTIRLRLRFRPGAALGALFFSFAFGALSQQVTKVLAAYA